MDLARGKRLPLATHAGAVGRAALVLRLATGAIFAAFGASKFINHASEAHSFRTYGLPSPDAFVYFIGVIETAGGILLIIGLATRLAALVLSGDMVGAIAIAGVKEGGVLNLGLAPVLLATMLFLLWAGSGPVALDQRLLGNRDRERAAARG
jgi:putative oxidoreductase